MTVQPNAESLAEAAIEFWQRFVPHATPLKDFEEGNEVAARVRSAMQAAITAFLSAERARGVELMPREPSAEMVISGVAERHGQPVPEAWSLATENIWRAMWDAGAQK